MSQWLIIVFVVVAGLAVSLFIPQSDYECVLYPEVVCVEAAEGLSDEAAAHDAVRQFVRAEYGVIAPSLAEFSNEVEGDHVLRVEGTTYTFTSHAATPEWSMTVERLSATK